MQQKEVVELSSQVLLDYYRNNLQPFFDACSDEVVWMGPAQGQFIRGKDAMLEAFGREENTLTFEVFDFAATPMRTGTPEVVEVLMTFTVDTFWPDGTTNRVNQRISLLWANCRKDPKITFVHISNEIAYDDRDTIYPLHYTDSISHNMPLVGQSESRKLTFRGTDKTIYIFNYDRIMYISSGGTHCFVHSISGTFEVIETLLSIQKRYDDLFVRVHASHTVNINYVEGISRFKVHMIGGTLIPVPERKYTKVKAHLLEEFRKMGLELPVGSACEDADL